MGETTFETWVTVHGQQWHVRLVHNSDTGKIDIYLGIKRSSNLSDYPHHHYYYNPNPTLAGETVGWSFGKHDNDSLGKLEGWMKPFLAEAISKIPPLTGNDFSLASLERDIDRASKYDRQLWENAKEQGVSLEKLWKDRQISPNHYKSTREQLNSIFERLKRMKAEEEEKAREYCAKMKSAIEKAIQDIERTEDSKPLSTDTLVKLKDDLRQAKLCRELYESIDKGFEIFKRKRNERKNRQEDRFKVFFNQIDNINRSIMSKAPSSDEARNFRSQLQEIQNKQKESNIQKEHRDQLWNKIQEGFKGLNSWREKREAEQLKNNQYLQRRVQDCVYEARSTSDFKASREKFKGISQEIYNSDLRKEDREYMKKQMNEAFQTLQTRNEQIRAEKQREWENKLYENLRNLKEQLSNTESRIRGGEEALSRQYDRYRNVRPGPKESQIKREIDERMSQIRSDISAKRSKADSLRQRIQDVESKLRNR